MVKVQVEVRNEISSFAVVVPRRELRRAVLIAHDLYSGRDVGISFPIDPGGFFGVGPTTTNASIQRRRRGSVSVRSH